MMLPDHTEHHQKAMKEERGQARLPHLEPTILAKFMVAVNSDGRNPTSTTSRKQKAHRRAPLAWFTIVLSLA